MAKSKKSPRPKARQPRGFPDRTAADIRATEAMVAKIRQVYELYGFDPVETPMFEYTDALGKFLPDQDRPNEGVFSIRDDDEQWMSLRYDLTAPLARHVAQNMNGIMMPYRTYRAGWVFRNEKPGPGRFRQFMQVDADTVGAPGPAADAEMCMMMADVMEALGVARGDYVVRVNSRRLLESVMNAANVQADKRHDVLRSIDKLDRIGVEGVRSLLGEGRIDASGDRMPGVGLSDDSIDIIEKLFSIKEQGRSDYFLMINFSDLLDDDYVVETDPPLSDKSGKQVWGAPDVLDAIARGIGDYPEVHDAIRELKEISRIVRSAGYGTKRIRLSPFIVRGLEYYTGAVYECELTFPVTNERGETVTFGSVAGGGRYDGLVKRFTGQDVPATGFSIGVSRLQTALKNLGKLPDDDVLAPVLVTVMDREPEALASYQNMVRTLRDEGIRAEMYQGNPKQFGKQLQYADRRGCPVAIIQGSDERAAGEVQVKDLDEGKKLSAEIADNQAWRAARPAQVTCKVEDLIPTVRSMLQAQREQGAAAGPA